MQQKIKQMGYFATKITEVAAKRKGKGKGKGGKRKKGKRPGHRWCVDEAAVHVHTSVLDLARRRPAGAAQPAHPRTPDEAGVLKNALIDVVDDVESGMTLSEAFAKHPKCFDGSTSTWSRPARRAVPWK